MKKHEDKNQLSLPILADMISMGDGNYILKPRVISSDLDTWIKSKEAAKILGIDRHSVYDLLDESEPFLVSQRPLKRKILISIKSIQAYKKATADPAFWRTPSIRRAFIDSVRTAIATLCAHPDPSLQPQSNPIAKPRK